MPDSQALFLRNRFSVVVSFIALPPFLVYRFGLRALARQIEWRFLPLVDCLSLQKSFQDFFLSGIGGGIGVISGTGGGIGGGGIGGGGGISGRGIGSTGGGT